MADEKDVSTTPDVENVAEGYSTQRRQYWTEELDAKRGDLLLLACCFVTGLLDCSTFRNWAIFVSMQTGNTIILCLSTANLPHGQPWAWAATLISLLAFFLGAFICTRLSTLLGPKKRLILTLNILSQALLITLSAALATASITLTSLNGRPEDILHDPRILVSVAPLAFQSGMTIATSRLLGFGNEIPVTVYTSTYAALAGDPKLFHLKGNRPRDRRVAAVICVFAGAFVATWAEKEGEGILVTFWISAGIKFVLAGVVAFLFKRKTEGGEK